MILGNGKLRARKRSPLTGQSGKPISAMHRSQTEKRRTLMQKTVYNPQKGRLETITITFTDKNTTWFDDIENNTGVS